MSSGEYFPAAVRYQAQSGYIDKFQKLNPMRKMSCKKMTNFSKYEVSFENCGQNSGNNFWLRKPHDCTENICRAHLFCKSVCARF